MLERIDYFCYPVADMERAVRFYTEVLGLTLVRKGEKWSELRCGSQKIALMLLPRKVGGSGARVKFVTDHLDEVITALKNKGVRIEELDIKEDIPGRIFFDSEGNEITIFQQMSGADTEAGGD